jgi:hypothetical protein
MGANTLRVVILCALILGIGGAVLADVAPRGSDSRNALLFVQNVGQFDDAVEFRIAGSGGTVWLTRQALWLTLVSSAATLPGDVAGDPPATGVNIRLSFPGSNARAHPEPFDRRATRVSYFLGNEPARWRANVPAWGGVRYRDLYPGIDLELRGDGGGLAPRLVLHPGAKPDAVRLRIEGADAIEVADEALRLRTAAGELMLPLLRIENADGTPAAPDQRPSVEGDEVRVPFARATQGGESDAPAAGALVYSTFLGGGREDFGQSIALDASGAAYVTGFTLATDFPVTPGAFQPGCGSCIEFYHDAFVSKLSPDGRTLVYSTYLGGRSTDCFYSDTWDSCNIAVDASGSAYVAGFTLSSDFPTTPGAYDRSCNSCDYNFDAFVTKLDPSGTALVYSTYLGSTAVDDAHGIAIDASGAAYVTGRTTSPDFPVTPGAFQRACRGGGYDAFVTKLNPSGSGLVYSTFLGGSDDDCHIFGSPAASCGIAIDARGAAYVTGSTESDDFPTTPGAFQPSCVEPCFFAGDAYVSKLDPSGSTLEYSTFLGGETEDAGANLAVDAAGAAYVVGSSQSTDFPTTAGAFQPGFAGNSDAFIAKLNGTGSALEYATYLGGPHDPRCVSCGDYGYDIAIDRSGAAVVTGFTASFRFPVTPDAFQPKCGGPAIYCGDVFVSRLSPDGAKLAYSTYIGTNSQEQGNSVALDAQGFAYVTGYTGSSRFPVTPDAAQVDFGGYSDAFVAKLDVGGSSCTITGTDGDDTLTGTDGVDVMCGLGGNDVLSGGLGNDVLRGGTGGDTLRGDAGNDRIDARDGVSGNDIVDGGPGVDRCEADEGDLVSNCP